MLKRLMTRCPARAGASTVTARPTTTSNVVMLTSLVSSRRWTTTPTAKPVAENETIPDSRQLRATPVSLEESMATGVAPYRKVGNIFVVRFIDHFFKHGPEVGQALRSLRFEFKGQTTIHPDIPEVRKHLFAARHCLAIDILSLDEAKQILGIPQHIEFRDLAAQLPQNPHKGPAVGSPFMATKVMFSQYRRARLADILQRDEVEKQLLETKKKLLAKQQQKKA